MNGGYGTKVFLTASIKELDRQTLLVENITESDLIARAAQALFEAIHKLYPPKREALLFCGPGNNGNDGRVLAPLLTKAGYDVKVFDLTHGDVPLLSTVPDDTLLIDALFGSGLTRPLEGVAAAWVRSMNNAKGIRIAIDIPSGLHGEVNDISEDFVAVKAHHTLTLEFPKLSLFFPECAEYAGEWQVVPFGLSPKVVGEAETPYRMVNLKKLKELLKPLPKFLHKCTAGRVRLLAGSRGMMGAAALAVKAAYRTGAGWVQALVPESEMGLLQMMVPEAIVRSAEEPTPVTDAPIIFGAGPGLGISDMAISHLTSHISHLTSPCILDADALNILAMHPELWKHIPENTMVTPHPGEFVRLAGAWKNDFERLQLQLRFAAQHHIIVILKGAHTSIAFPDGTVYFNTSGNPGMATAGSGDVLTGILLGLLAQGLPPHESAILGAYLHGVAGDLAAEALGERSVMASDMIKNISQAMQHF